MQRIYAAIDLKSFYASVECVERGLDPLKTNLVVADESRTDKTICLAVSPSLKAYGIPGRARLFEVKAKLREYEARTKEKVDFIIARPQMYHYLKKSAEIYSIYMKYIAPEDVVVYSVDEVFMDLTDYLNTYDKSAHELVMDMIHDVLKTTGITATAGIGTNLYLAKIAMDIKAKHMKADSDGVRIAELDEDSFKREMWPHEPLTDFWRTGPGTARKLQEYGMYTMGDVARRALNNEEIFYKLFGIDAEILIDHAFGIEPVTMKEIKAYKPMSSSLSEGQVLSEPYTFEKARVIIDEMAEIMALRLVEKGLVTDSVTIQIGYDKEAVERGYSGDVVSDRYGRVIPKNAHGTIKLGNYTSSTKVIIDHVLQLYDRIVDKKLTVRRMYINANDVRREEDTFYQLGLFEDKEKLDKEKKMQKAIVSIKSKYGKNALLRGTNLLEGATAVERNREIGGHKA